MKKTLSCVTILAAIQVVSIGTANATIETFIETYKLEAPVFLTPDNIYFDQTIELQGFNSETDTIKSASLEFFFLDDGQDESEKVDIRIDGQLVSGVSANQNFKYNFSSPPASIVDGKLTFELFDVQVGGGNSHIGDFYFDKTVLTVSVERKTPEATDVDAPANNVPEPGSLALAGLGLVGLAAGRRKTK